VKQMNDSQRGIAAAALFLLAGALWPLGAQTSEPMLSGMNPMGQNPHGLQLYDLTGFVGWTSMASPQRGLILQSNGTLLGSDTTVGGGGSLGWALRGAKTRFAIRYSGGYDGEFRYTEWNAFYHFLSMSVSRRLTSKLTLNLSARGSVSNYNQLLFSPTIFGSLVAAPGSFEDLSAAVLSGQYNNDQLASLLTGAPVIDSPSRTVFFGNRVFTGSGAITMGYAHTRRLSFGFNADYGYEQHLADANSDAPKTSFLLPHASYGMAGVNVSYALSRRTQIGAGTSSGRSFSGIQQSYTHSANIFLGHEINRHWFMQANAGAGFATNVHANPPMSTLGTRPSFGAKLGYRTYAHTFMASYERMLTLAYGAGASDTTMVGGGWRWWQPGHTWGVSASGADEFLHNPAFRKISGWRGTFGITKQMGMHTVLESGYSYGAYSSGLLSTTPAPESPGAPSKSHQHTVRLTVVWYPQSLERQ
jgi:hypothetical protein